MHSKNKLRVAVVGATGAVGQECIRLLKERNFPLAELILFDSKSPPSFAKTDLAFFCVSADLAKTLIPMARNEGTICIDSSSGYREDSEIPLVIPEINLSQLNHHKGIIASPNCTTTLMLLPLTPLHRKFQIKRIVASTYQAVSGAGTKGIKELEEQTRAYLAQDPLQPEIFPSSCAFNVFPHESELLPSGFVGEENKMVIETRKILGDATIQVSATCVRVPVFRAHSIALNVEFHHPITKEEAMDLLSTAPGVCLLKEQMPSARDATHQDAVYCARVRIDPTQPNTLSLWVVGDQLLKGAALNMVQIGEHLSKSVRLSPVLQF